MTKTLALIAALGLALAPLASAQTGANGPAKGQVWSTGATYHCPGTRYFGKTKAGAYMLEADAVKAGAKGARGKTCAEVAQAKTAQKTAAKPATAKGGAR